MKRKTTDIAENLFKKLWEQFLRRVRYARLSVELINRKGGRVVADHVGFRTLGTHTGEQPEGIGAIRHIIECLGYRPSEEYTFTKKKLKAVHFEAENPRLPKIFVSQLQVSQLPNWALNLLPDIVADTPYLLSDAGIELLGKLKRDGILPAEAADILEDELVNYFRRPWNPPFKDAVLKLNDVSHYAAWTLLHGNSPSHFGLLANALNVAAWPDLETTCRVLKKAGIPMKENIEGEKGSLLQQSATLAVKEDVPVRGDDGQEEIIWTYAYLELIQRGVAEENGQRWMFSGFIESQERQLYNMTRTLEN